MCAVGCRKALELAVKWVYAADSSIEMPYRDNLQSLIHEQSFRFAMDGRTWGKLPYIVKLGNLAVHTERNVASGDAIASLKGLFEFIEWIDYCYGEDYEERSFDESLIPKEKRDIDEQKINKQESLIEEKEAVILELQKKIEEMSETFTKSKAENKNSREFEPEEITEYETRKRYIDIDLKFLGWKLDGESQDVIEEYQVENMAGNLGQKGYVDYVF